MRQQKLTGLDWLATKIPLHYKSIKYIKVDVPIVSDDAPASPDKSPDPKALPAAAPLPPPSPGTPGTEGGGEATTGGEESPSPKKKKKKKDKTPRAEPDIEEGGAKEDVVQTM